jgi:hypothetical protein
MKIPYMRATMLMGTPRRPNLNRLYTGCLLSNFLSKMKKIGMMYDMYRENVARDIIVRNIVVEPTLIR